MKTYIVALFAFSLGMKAEVEFSGFTITAKDSLFTVTHIETSKSSPWLKIGDSFSGWTVVSFDRGSETLTVARANETLQLPLRSSKIRTGDDTAEKLKPAKSETSEKPIRLRLIQITRAVGETDANLIAKANVILARITGGEAFEKLAQEFDQGVRRSRGGDWGWQGPSDVKPQFREAIMSLKKGDVSAPILIKEGCFLLYAEDRQ